MTGRLTEVRDYSSKYSNSSYNQSEEKEQTELRTAGASQRSFAKMPQIHSSIVPISGRIISPPRRMTTNFPFPIIFPTVTDSTEFSLFNQTPFYPDLRTICDQLLNEAPLKLLPEWLMLMSDDPKSCEFVSQIKFHNPRHAIEIFQYLMLFQEKDPNCSTASFIGELEKFKGMLAPELQAKWIIFSIDLIFKTNRFVNQEKQRLINSLCDEGETSCPHPHLAWHFIYYRLIFNLLLDPQIDKKNVKNSIDELIKNLNEYPNNSHPFTIAFILIKQLFSNETGIRDFHNYIDLEIQKAIHGKDYKIEFHLLKKNLWSELLGSQPFSSVQRSHFKELLLKKRCRFFQSGLYWATLVQMCDTTTVEDIKYRAGLIQEGLKNVPKSGELWCEVARVALVPKGGNPLKENLFINAIHALNQAMILTPQYGDSFFDYLSVLLRWEKFQIEESARKGMNGAEIESIKQRFENKRRKLKQIFLLTPPSYGFIFELLKKNKYEHSIEIWNRGEKLVIENLNKSSYTAFGGPIYEIVNTLSPEQREECLLIMLHETIDPKINFRHIIRKVAAQLLPQNKRS